MKAAIKPHDAQWFLSRATGLEIGDTIRFRGTEDKYTIIHGYRRHERALTKDWPGIKRRSNRAKSARFVLEGPDGYLLLDIRQLTEAYPMLQVELDA